ncbi:hypothetical protein OEZ71_09800 [Defluviimonas sp. WL0050]|uniref:Uncharacterized protein n=1 Tax=Albidovulum litorale TaxID=2984134 RepID=A0ABT2ZNA3_9RHOB|nr:hypothetical protein [Defluviimonas sp. WL0050]MCV2872592.1 hypothetical protein [Defluviimonas sp. WL0050]
MKREAHGSGITEYSLNLPETAVEQKEVMRQNTEAWNAAMRDGGGIFGAVTSNAVYVCNEVLRQSENAKPFLEDTPEAFADVILTNIDCARHEIADGNADLAARHAFDAGVEWAKAQMKWQWEADALRGGKVHAGSKSAGQETSRINNPLRMERFARMSELIPKLGKSRAAKICEREGLGNSSAILKQWNRHQES